ncbi:MAG TPA: hypothetical protein VE379_06120 [Vicinamibacterales bacterium]|nr:hypothetical protein [Vicinamibacterales bacterium]
MGMNRLWSGSAVPRVSVAILFSIAAGVHAARAQAPPAAAQQPAKSATAALPGARSILDRHLTAVGGRDAILAHSSTKATGVFSVASAGLTGTLEVFAAKPNKNLVRIQLPGVGEIVEGFDGTHGWTVSAMTGPMLLEGKQLEEKKFDADFHAELHDDARYESMTTMEVTDFDGRACYKLRLVKKGGGEDFEFYDVKTGLRAGRTGTRETPMGTVTGTAVEGDYRKFGKLLLPTSIRNTLMGTEQVITIKTVEFDTVPANAFEPPAAIKALLK